MNKKKNLLLTLLALALLLGGASALYARLGRDGTATPAAAQSARPTGGEAADHAPAPAPDFTVYDIDGNAVHLSDFAGTPVVLNFWASWCGPCKSEMPDFDQAAAAYDGQVQFLMVNLTDGARETVDSATNYVTEQGFSFPVFYDTDTDAAMAYRVFSIPTTYFIDSDGYAVARLVGATDGETLAQGIDLMLSEG
ncbi:MAG: TlpA family protein disulfide reductase [Agathobaculum sp.]|uniref:TlpA family protein disulfide reductase n=1 Tax=Agathobaculum sp. TaxID=2048138 RepID=UPI0025BCD20C|nr:TlpA disulfide reductase family protein [Agathobaculum sp.]MCI7126471.1 TlpA family protein disulfide reductase [Agathobaculum sp.]MDY3711464.1 TlpA disulfide reductase family protein [Agathobaculum sp.]